MRAAQDAGGYGTHDQPLEHRYSPPPEDHQIDLVGFGAMDDLLRRVSDGDVRFQLDVVLLRFALPNPCS